MVPPSIHRHHTIRYACSSSSGCKLDERMYIHVRKISLSPCLSLSVSFSLSPPLPVPLCPSLSLYDPSSQHLCRSMHTSIDVMGSLAWKRRKREGLPPEPNQVDGHLSVIGFLALPSGS